MLFLYKTSSAAFREKAVDVLERHGIEIQTRTLPHNLRNFGIGDNRSAEHDIYVSNDNDFAFAKQLLIEIGADNPAPVQMPDVSLLIGLGLALLAAGLYLFDNG